MNRRERTLSIVVAGLLGIGVVYMAANRLVLGKIRRYNADETRLRSDIDKLERETAVLARQKGAYAALRDRTYGDAVLKAGLRARLRIDRIVRQAGLSQSSVSVSPFSSSGTRTKFGEVGCTVRGECTLERLTNFLYLLSRDSYLHRITSLDVTPPRDRESFRFSLRYASPVLDWTPPVPVAARKAPTTQMAELASLSAPGRAAYDLIARRNIFKPYRPPRVPYRPRRGRTPPRQPPAPRPQQRRPDPLDRMIVSALPSRSGVAEVHVQYPGVPNARVFKVGDRLPVGQIATVDYRVMPMPGNPKILSASRVILRLGKDYRAVELGQPLGRWRALRPAEVPDRLRPKPPRATTRPAKGP